MTKIQNRLYNFLLDNDLNYLTFPYVELINNSLFLDFKILKNIFYSKDFLLFEKTLINYFIKFSITFKDRNVFNSCSRQNRFRLKNKVLQKKQLNFYVDIKVYNQLQNIKGALTYEEVLKQLLAKK